MEAFTQTFTDDGEPAELVPETVKRSRSAPNAYALKKHQGLKFTVQIDGVQPGADEFVEYYLQWRHLTGDPALRKVMDHNRHLREQIEDLQARLKVLE
ncbi:hypothetical protein EOM89_01625 [Candidatus Falkowbacteria bacterium]|nr:hypothetical protein [Candidatus Falkowbacteria bacterium]